MHESTLIQSTQESHHAPSGWLRRCVFSTDHKVIGRQYLAISLLWAVMGGLIYALALAPLVLFGILLLVLFPEIVYR